MSISNNPNDAGGLHCSRNDLEEALIDNFLDRLEERVQIHSRSNSTSIISIGGALVQAKQCVELGQFKHWVTTRCGFTIRSAQNYMRAFKLASEVGEIVSLLSPAALYRLSAQNTSPAVIEIVLDMLRNNFVPTEAEVIVLIADPE